MTRPRYQRNPSAWGPLGWMILGAIIWTGISGLIVLVLLSLGVALSV